MWPAKVCQDRGAAQQATASRAGKVRAYTPLPGQVTLLHLKQDEKRTKTLSFVQRFSFLFNLEDSLPREVGCSYQLTWETQEACLYIAYMCA